MLSDLKKSIQNQIHKLEPQDDLGIILLIKKFSKNLKHLQSKRLNHLMTKLKRKIKKLLKMPMHMLIQGSKSELQEMKSQNGTIQKIK